MIQAIYQRAFPRTYAAQQAALEEVTGVTLTDVGRVQCGLVTFAAETRSAKEIKSRLGERGINVAVSPRNFTRLDMEDRGLKEGPPLL